MDNENIIDFKEWNVPTKWADITLKQFQEIQRYYDNDEEKSVDIRDIIHILTNKTIDEVNALPAEFLQTIMVHLVFLQTEPDIKKPSNIIELNGEKYIINVMEKLKTGEYVSAEMILKNDKYDYASLLAVLCRKEGEIYDSKFEAEVFEKRKQMFENASMLKIMPLVNFFLQLWLEQKSISQLSSKVEEAISHIQQSIANSDEIGVFKKWYLKWRVMTLQKSLRSSKNISQTSCYSLPTLLKRGKWKKKRMLSKKIFAKRKKDR